MKYMHLGDIRTKMEKDNPVTAYFNWKEKDAEQKKAGLLPCPIEACRHIAGPNIGGRFYYPFQKYLT